jgi:hypothetical protein
MGYASQGGTAVADPVLQQELLNQKVRDALAEVREACLNWEGIEIIQAREARLEASLHFDPEQYWTARDDAFLRRIEMGEL